MRVAVISDVHANEHALTAVLAAVEAASPDEVWCLGDTVGYGPAPNRCCEVVAARADLCLVGNHDLVVTGALSIDEFNHDARAAAEWTREELTAANRDWLSGFEPESHRPGVGLFHASPPDPVWGYVLSAEAAWLSFAAATEPLILVGHSHVALSINGNLEGGVAADGERVELESGRWILNPGSVGQPRDGDPRAAWLELDLDGRFARFHRVAYSIERTQADIRAAGLPEALAERLAHGA
jgi:diadenosine tetraphosphatase ApaH/serine/threonine PP2A family protein phosphatase